MSTPSLPLMPYRSGSVQLRILHSRSTNHKDFVVSPSATALSPLNAAPLHRGVGGSGTVNRVTPRELPTFLLPSCRPFSCCSLAAEAVVKEEVPPASSPPPQVAAPLVSCHSHSSSACGGAANAEADIRDCGTCCVYRVAMKFLLARFALTPSLLICAIIDTSVRPLPTVQDEIL